MVDQVVITQPYVPAYRVPLFAELDRQLDDVGLQLKVLSARPSGLQAHRGDSTTGQPWHDEVSSRSLRVSRWSIHLRELPHYARTAALLVSELEALNLTAWRDTVRRRPTVLWGHGKGFVNDTGATSDFVESILAGRVEHTMTYTPAGREYLISSGRVNPASVTAIGNSTDTTLLRQYVREELALGGTLFNAPRALYVGGLDASKRIEYLLRAFEHAASRCADFHLTIVGKGADEALVRQMASASHRLEYFPEARGRDLARLGARASAMWVPGRVGLVAVDALALGLPIHTTQYPYHAPEIEFLRAGEVEYLGPDPEDFAEQSIEMMGAQPAVRVMRNDIPSVEAVAERMVMVVTSALGA